jgi:hypothetical protein
VILGEVGTCIDEDDDYTELECHVEDYDHAQLVEWGGFGKKTAQNTRAFYGKSNFPRKELAEAHRDRLIDDLMRRKNQRSYRGAQSGKKFTVTKSRWVQKTGRRVPEYR